jgi:hypothetical protein
MAMSDSITLPLAATTRSKAVTDRFDQSAAALGFNHIGMWNMPFQKGNQLAKGHNGGLRRDSTVELVTQLNELIKCADGTKRTKLHRLICRGRKAEC